MPPLPHEARLRITGWATPTEGGLRIGGLFVRTSKRLDADQRVTLTAHPRTRADGTLTRLNARARAIRPARPHEPNGLSFIVTGQLLRLSRGSDTLQVKVAPAQSDLTPFVISMQATTGILRDLDPATFQVQVTGRVIQAGPRLLLAEHAQAVHAPTPERWRRWRARRPRAVPTPPLEATP